MKHVYTDNNKIIHAIYIDQTLTVKNYLIISMITVHDETTGMFICYYVTYCAVI